MHFQGVTLFRDCSHCAQPIRLSASQGFELPIMHVILAEALPSTVLFMYQQHCSCVCMLALHHEPPTWWLSVLVACGTLLQEKNDQCSPALVFSRTCSCFPCTHYMLVVIRDASLGYA